MEALRVFGQNELMQISNGGDCYMLLDPRPITTVTIASPA